MTDKQMPLLWGAILWFAAALLLAARGVFVTRPNELPLALALAFLVPILLFVLGLGLSSRWRALVVSVPPVFLIALNGWRFIGLGFLMACLSKTFLAWNLFGIADFLDAVFLGTLYLWPGFTAGTNTALMQRLPFALIPSFFVPLVAMAHFTLLAQRRLTAAK